MATYYDIFGQKVQYLSSDPSPVAVGQVWYNSTSNTAKVQGYQAAAWSAGGSTNNVMSSGAMTTQGTQTAFLIWNGAAPGVDANPGYVESYNGTSWTNLSTSPYPATTPTSFGTQTSAVSAGGNTGAGGQSTTIEWNGSGWTGGGSLPYNRMYMYNGAGTSESDGITIGGWNQTSPTGGSKNDVIVYNGTAWSTDAATCPFPQYTGTHYGTGSSDVNLFGGYNPPAPESRNNDHVNYNGTTFTALSVYPLRIASASSAGTTSEAYVWSGNTSPGDTAVGNSWDGTSWASSTSYPSTKSASYSGGSSVGVALNASGQPYNQTTFEYQAAGAVTQTLTTS